MPKAEFVIGERKPKTGMEIPPEALAQVSIMFQQVKALTLMALTECHDPDFQVTQERIREFFSKLESETFQRKLFEE